MGRRKKTGAVTPSYMESSTKKLLNPMAHITPEQRYTISGLLQQRKSISEISQTNHKHRSVVWREIKRNSSSVKGIYTYKSAQQRAELRQKQKKRHRRFTLEVQLFVEQKIREDYSPEQIVGYAKLHGIACVSITTIYKYIWDNKANYTTVDRLFHHLRVGRKKGIKAYSKRTGFGTIPNRVMIAQRPDIVAKRERFGDFEADTMWIANKAVIVTVNDRATGISHIKQLPDRKADNVNKAIADMLKPYNGMIKTITVDNGKEFFRNESLAKLLNCDVYFAEPYASWQRGSNENVNGLYRQYLPRNTRIETLSDEYIHLIESKINNRPRKRYGYLSPAQKLTLNINNTLLHL